MPAKDPGGRANAAGTYWAVVRGHFVASYEIARCCVLPALGVGQSHHRRQAAGIVKDSILERWL